MSTSLIVILAPLWQNGTLDSLGSQNFTQKEQNTTETSCGSFSFQMVSMIWQLVHLYNYNANWFKNSKNSAQNAGGVIWQFKSICESCAALDWRPQTVDEIDEIVKSFKNWNTHCCIDLLPQSYIPALFLHLNNELVEWANQRWRLQERKCHQITLLQTHVKRNTFLISHYSSEYNIN